MTDTDDLARRIYQSLLDGIGDAVRLSDFDRYLPFFHLPHRLETFEGVIEIDTREALMNVFVSVCSRLKELDVSELARDCSVAQFDGPGTIRGCHDTRLISQDGAVRDAYSSLTTLQLFNGQWKLSNAQYAEDKVSLPSLTLRDQLARQQAHHQDG